MQYSRTTQDRLAALLSPIGKDNEGRQFEYAGRFGLSHGAFRVVKDKAAWDAIKSRFEETKDAQGMTMEEFSRRYWDDPDFQAEVRRQIAEGRARGNR